MFCLKSFKNPAQRWRERCISVSIGRPSFWKVSYTLINVISGSPNSIAPSFSPIRPRQRKCIHPQQSQSRWLNLITHIRMPNLMRPSIHSRLILMNRVHPRQVWNDTRHLVNVEFSKIGSKSDLLVNIQLLVSQENYTTLARQQDVQARFSGHHQIL